MSRRPVVDPVAVERLRTDPRLLRAMAHRRPAEGWRDQGRCLSADPEVFFPEVKQPADAALTVCRTCPVAAQCLASALECGDVDGVWGQTTQEERRAMRVSWARLPALA